MYRFIICNCTWRMRHTCMSVRPIAFVFLHLVSAPASVNFFAREQGAKSNSNNCEFFFPDSKMINGE
jgi:hypothetical protein